MQQPRKRQRTATTATTATAPKQPNILIIVADDLGYSDLGCYGSEISTPHLDLLAREGSRMLNFHTTPSDSPTRAELLTGVPAHLCGLGCQLEYKDTPWGAARWAGRPGYEGFLTRRVATIGEILRERGYFTAIAGKWHLGLRPEHTASHRGFDRSFCLLPGSTNHYCWEPDPTDVRSALPLGGKPIHVEDGRRWSRSEKESRHSTDLYTDKLLEYLGDRPSEKPFCAILTYSAPHWPLQCPASIRRKYKDMYKDGPAELRRGRLARLAKLGIIDPAVIPHDVVAPEAPEWDTLTPEQQEASASAMSAYAGMVEHLDAGVGRVLSHLKSDGAYDDTMILFASDSGADGSAYESLHGLEALLSQLIPPQPAPVEIGDKESHAWLGPRWAQAVMAPFRLYKTFPTEGGLRAPCIVKMPSSRPALWTGNLERAFVCCRDVVPTILDLLNIDLVSKKGKANIGGHDVHAPRGRSWLPRLSRGQHADPSSGDSAAVYPVDSVVCWELYARAAARKGRWKIVHVPRSHGGAGVGDDGWELFDVEADPGETRDLAETQPEKLEELLAHWHDYVREVGIVWSGTPSEALSRDEHPQLYDSDQALQQAWLATPVHALMQAKTSSLSSSSTLTEVSA